MTAETQAARVTGLDYGELLTEAIGGPELAPPDRSAKATQGQAG